MKAWPGSILLPGHSSGPANDEKDRQLAIELTNDQKENAEHVMLVDLARNDLSRNSDEVMVKTYRETQFYSHVIHLVSEVTGVLKEGYNAVRVFADSFPAGTLSGAPKFRAMELIDDYETDRPGFLWWRYRLFWI